MTRQKEGPNGEDIQVVGKFTAATKDPSIVANSDVILLAVPAFAHGGYLEAIKPHVRKSGSKAPGGRVMLGALAGQSSFDVQVSYSLHSYGCSCSYNYRGRGSRSCSFCLCVPFQVHAIFGQELYDACTLFNVETLPWAARFREFGKSADILGTKESVDIAVTPHEAGPEVIAILRKMMAAELPKYSQVSGMLALTLSSQG